MPFVIRREGSEYCVHKHNEDGSIGRSYGCHSSEEQAREQQRALYAAEGRGEMTMTEDDLRDVLPDENAHRFQAVLTLEGTPTSDGRYFPPGSLTWRTLPIPLMWQRTEPEGGLGGNPHGGAVLVGRITDIERRGDEIWGWGVFDTGDDGVEAERLVTEQMMRWVSIDVVSGNIVQEESRVVINNGIIGAATLVALPAFAQAVIAPTDATIPENATELGRGEAIMASINAPTAPPATWFTNPAFGTSDDDPRLVRQRSGEYACPLTITDGRIFGHLFASRDQCHIGFPSECVTPPPSNYDYAYALRGSTLTDGGTKIPTATITMGCGHAPHGIVTAQAIAHYDGGPGAVQVADVILGEDRYATWFSGALRPDLTDAEVRALRGMGQVSGDWRRIGGSLELIAVLAVPVPGYPINRIAASGEDCEDCSPSPYQTSARLVDGEILSLIAAAPVALPDPMTELVVRVAALEAWKIEQEREALRARIT